MLDPKNRIVGVVVRGKDGKLQLSPTNEKGKGSQYNLTSTGLSVRENDVVVAERVHQKGAVHADVKRVLGQKNSPGILTLVSITERGLSDVFSEAAQKEAKSLTVPSLQDREDLRNIPLVTVDGADSRDFDDAIYAEDTPDGGKHLIVAIADVSWYVRPGSALDKAAYERGNSTYFPDRAVPMLPEEISNGLCSLKPNEDRACMVYHLWIDKDGNLTNKKINRGLMRSAARLTYDQLQAAKDGNPDSTTAPLMNTVIKPLYAAYEILKQASEARGMLDLNAADDRAASHDVIAQFMILANIAGDTALQEAKATAIHRFHNAPPEEKVKSLNDYLGRFGLTLPSGQPITDSRPFKELIEKTKQMPNGSQIIRSVINAIARAQAKAIYDAQSDGHFGLALTNYGHHTSPIRRYADLLNHRSLVEVFNMGAGALTGAEKSRIDEMAEHITQTEMESTKAERIANDRFAVALLAQHTGKELTGRIVNIGPPGVFVKLDISGTDGLLPTRYLQPSDDYVHDRKQRTLTGKHHGRVYKTGENIKVILKEADALKGSAILKPVNDNNAGVNQRFKKSAPTHRKQGHKPH